MGERRMFKHPHSDAEIFLHPDGSLTIEAFAEYGDTEIGWGSTCSTVRFDPNLLAEFRKFIEPEGK